MSWTTVGWCAALFATLAVGAAGCDRGGDDATPTNGPTSTTIASPRATATSTAFATASVEATATPPPGSEGASQIPSRVHLIDAASGKVTTLYDSSQHAAWARFDGDIVEVRSEIGVQQFDLDGRPSTTPAYTDACQLKNGSAEIGGRTFAGIPCGSVSPDRRWMTYTVDAGSTTLPSGYQVPLWDQWLLDVSNGAARLLQAGLVHCGGCDARYGPRWSPTSDYVAFAELGGTARRFLSKVASGDTRIIGAGNEITDAPVWARAGNRIVYSTVAHGQTARIEDLDAGTAADLPIAWPVRFDPSGAYLYSPAGDDDRKSAGDVTTIIDAGTFATIALLPGAPPQWLAWIAGSPAAKSASGYVAALQSAPGCAGTNVTREASPPLCISGGIEGVTSPDGSLVAVVSVEGTIGPAYGPGFQTINMLRCDIQLIDTKTMTARRMLSDVPNFDFGAPVVAWNAAGTHMLVVSPVAPGL